MEASDAPAQAVIFDIDGTLISTGGASDRAWRSAFVELYGVEVNVGDYTGKGVTDPAVGLAAFRGALGREPSDGEMAKLMALRLRHLPDEVERSPDYRVMPGVEGLLGRLADSGVLLGLITGNVEAAAHVKLARARLNHHFVFGGYGSDAIERVDVARVALKRGGRVCGAPLAPDRCLAVGDTPRDVEAGHGAGVRVIGVGTGEYTADALAEAGADLALATLEDWRLP